MEWTELIRSYKPYNEQEEQDKTIMLRCMNTFDDVLTRNNGVAHITSSTFVVNKTRDKVLMIHHNIYNSWSWTGGHADGDGDLLAVAIKELAEETGVKRIQPVTSNIFSLDVLPVLGHVKKGKYVPAHLHLSVAFLIEVDETEPLVVKADENSGVMWMPINEMPACTNEPHMQALYTKLTAKIKA